MDPLNPVSSQAASRAGLWITHAQWEQMKQDVDRRLPEEACGLLGGRDFRALEIYPIPNSLHSPVRFRMDPVEQVQALIEIENRGWDLVAIYHSHPAGPPHPSPSDIAEAAYPEAVNLIWMLSGGEWSCRGFRINDGISQEIRIGIQPAE